MSFQITILKVLAGHPDGRASISELMRYVSILMTSGSDFTDRMRQLAARAPKLEIFGDRFVLRDGRGWCITESGRQFVASLDAPIPARAEHQASEAAAEPNQVQPTLRLTRMGSRAYRRTVAGEQSPVPKIGLRVPPALRWFGIRWAEFRKPS